MRQLIATIVTLSFLFTLSVASASTRVDDGCSQHISQAHAAHVVSISSAEAPEIEEDTEVAPKLSLIQNYIHKKGL